MAMLAVGLGLIAAAAILYFISRSNARLAIAAITTEVSTIGDLRALYERVSGEVGTGVFCPNRAPGQGRVRSPLASELGGATCIAYRFRVERRWDEQVEVRDSDGKVRRETRSGSDTVAGNDRRVEFWLDDGGDRISVNPDGASMDLEKVVDRFEPGSSGGRLRFGGFQLALAGRGSGGRRTLGYHYREDVLAVDRHVYVLGAATDGSGVLSIAKNRDGRAPFLISLKSREELVGLATRTAAYPDVQPASAALSDWCWH